MKPVLVFRHVSCEGPAYLGRFFADRSVPYRIIDSYRGDNIPETTDEWSGLVFMGGPMSVNDDIPWLSAEIRLIRAAYARQLPVLGHCLGGQLISKALGGRVTGADLPEIGWFPVKPINNQESPWWLHDLDFDTEIFHWHGEQFSLPDDAVPLFNSDRCKLQGFILGKIMSLQCHVEMEKQDIGEWLTFYQDEIPDPGDGIQTAEEISGNLDDRISRLQKFADTLYTAWFQGLNRN